MAATKTPSASAKPAAKPAVKTATKPARKPAAKPVTKPAGANPAPTLVVVETAAASAPSAKVGEVKNALKLKTLVEQVIKATGAKKKGVKEIVEATLEALGAALSRGDDLQLPPLGKAKVGRQKDKAGGEMIVVKLNRTTAKAKREKPANEGVADDGEDS